MKALRRYIKWILAIVMLLAVVFAFVRMGGAETISAVSKVESSVTSLSNGWRCTVDGSSDSFEATLPSILPLPDEASAITLTNTLPMGIKSGDALRLQTLSGWFEIFIDGKLRIEYGNREITNLYWYENASTLLMIKLTQEDAGKEIAIHAGSIDAHHLAIQREPFIGYHRDFLMSDMIESSYGNMLIIMMIAASIVLLFVWLFFFVKKQTIYEIPSAVAFLLMMVLYYNVANLFMMELLSYAPRYFSFNDFVYYVLNVFLPIAGYMIILPYLKQERIKVLKYFIAAHVALAVFLFVLQVVAVEFYEPVEKAAALMTLIGYIWMILIIKNNPLSKNQRWFVYPVFICIFACLLDYYKYVMNLDWLPRALANYLQVDSPFMIFLPFAMVAYMFMLLVGIVQVIVKRQTQLAIEAEGAELRATHAEKEFFMTMESINSIRKMRHDIEHHFSVIDTYLAENDVTEARAYIKSASAPMPKHSLASKNLITGSFIEKYRALAEQNNIQFTDNILYDEELISNKTALGIIWGNGLKNAFEAAATAQGDLRFIRVSGKQVHDNVAIVIENGFSHEIMSDYKSTKGTNRGLGLSNIKDAATGCGGYMECGYRDNIFTLEVVIVIS